MVSEARSDELVALARRRHSRHVSPVLHNGTLTFLRTSKRLLGVTAAHVLLQYQEDHAASPVRLQVMDALLDAPQIIAISKGLDLATLPIPDSFIAQIGKEIVPLSAWPLPAPQEGRGVM